MAADVEEPRVDLGVTVAGVVPGDRPAVAEPCKARLVGAATGLADLDISRPVTTTEQEGGERPDGPSALDGPPDGLTLTPALSQREREKPERLL